MDTATPVNNHPFHLPHWIVILLLLFVPPVAWWHMWKNHRYHTWFPYVLWLNAAITLGFAAYVVVHFYPLLTTALDNSMFIFASHVGLLLFAVFEIVFGFYLIKMFKNEAMLKRRILAIVITLLFINTIAIPLSQLIITSTLQNRSKMIPVAVTKQNTNPTANPDSIEANWKTYTNAKYGFSFKYPPNLSYKATNPDDTYGIIVSLPGLAVTDSSYAGGDVKEKDITLQEYLKKYAANYYNSADSTPENESIPESIKTITTKSGATGYQVRWKSKDTNEIFDDVTYFKLPNSPLRPYISVSYGSDERNKAVYDQILSTFKFSEPENIDPKTGWKIYTDEKSRFTFQYPQIFEKDYTRSYFFARTKKDSTNMLSVKVLSTSFADYSYKNLGGSTYSFDTDKKSWSPSGFKKTNTSFEAYAIPAGDAGCSGDVIVIPHADYSYVVEATILHCANIAADVVKPADVDLTTEEFLKTFTFLN